MSKECQGSFIGMVITPKDFIHRLNVRTTMYSCRGFIFGSDDHDLRKMAVASPDSRVKYIHTQIKDFVHTSYKTQSFALRGKGSENVVRIYETSGGFRVGARAPSYF